jgi:hypothetical protein
VLRIFIALKNPLSWPGSNPQPVGPVANTLTTTPPRQREWHYLCTKFYEILPSGSKIISEGTYRQPGDLISLLSFLENRLKIQKNATKQHVHKNENHYSLLNYQSCEVLAHKHPFLCIV